MSATPSPALESLCQALGKRKACADLRRAVPHKRGGGSAQEQLPVAHRNSDAAKGARHECRPDNPAGGRGNQCLMRGQGEPCEGFLAQAAVYAGLMRCARLATSVLPCRDSGRHRPILCCRKERIDDRPGNGRAAGRSASRMRRARAARPPWARGTQPNSLRSVLLIQLFSSMTLRTDRA